MEFKDVYSQVGKYLNENNFSCKSVDEQKELVEESFKLYLLNKIGEYGKSLEEGNYTASELVAILGQIIPEDKHFDTLGHVTHRLLNIVFEMQRFSVVWFVENRAELSGNPEVHFNSDNKWDKIITNSKIDHVKTFELVNYVFHNQFKVKENPKMIVKNYQG